MYVQVQTAGLDGSCGRQSISTRPGNYGEAVWASGFEARNIQGSFNLLIFHERQATGSAGSSSVGSGSGQFMWVSRCIGDEGFVLRGSGLSGRFEWVRKLVWGHWFHYIDTRLGMQSGPQLRSFVLYRAILLNLGFESIGSQLLVR